MVIGGAFVVGLAKFYWRLLFRVMSASGRFWRIVFSTKVLLALVVAGMLYAQFDFNQFLAAYANWPPGGKPTFSSRFSTWDIAHYLRLSEYGYKAGSPSCAFYPLWPAAIHLASVLTGGRPVLAAMLLANALSLLGFWLLCRLIGRHCGPDVSRDSLILMLAFPGALFFSFPYSESIYFVLVMLFFWGLELERWSWTAVAGFLLPLTKPTGAFVLLPLAWYFYERGLQRGKQTVESREETADYGGGSRVLKLETAVCPNANTPRRRDARAWEARGLSPAGESSSIASAKQGFLESVFASLRLCNHAGLREKPPRQHRISKRLAPWMLVFCPLLGYSAYFGLMYAWTGNAFEGFDAQKSYPNSPSIANMFNYTGFTNALLNIHTLDGMTDSVLDRACFVSFLALLLPIYRLNKVWFFYVLPTGLVPALSSWFMSYRRYFIVLFPAFVVLAQLLAKSKSRWVFWYYVVLLAAMQAWAVKQFINFNWAG